MSDINYEPKNEVIIATVASAPILTAETALIDVHQSTDKTLANAYQNLKKARGNSQGSLRFTVGNMGSLSEIDFRIYWYTTNPDGNAATGDVAFQDTDSVKSSGAEAVSLNVVKITATGSYNYNFPMMACDGIKVTVQGVGTNTNSSLTNVHLALRTN